MFAPHICQQCAIPYSQALAEAGEKVEESERRAAAAEAAKIDLTVALAAHNEEEEEREGRGDSSLALSTSARGSIRRHLHGRISEMGGGGVNGVDHPHLDGLVEELTRRAEEYNLAAAVQASFHEEEGATVRSAGCSLAPHAKGA